MGCQLGKCKVTGSHPRRIEVSKQMNVVFVSPQFPDTYWHFCEGLRKNGARVLGIGDTPWDEILPELKFALDEYYWVSSLEDYDQVFRAVAFFSYKYGKIDWIESNNEYWLAQDARLRDDFNVTTGAGSQQMAAWQSKAQMKSLYAAGGVPTARQTRLSSFDEVRSFVDWVGGYPVFAKPERGVGSGGTHKVCDDDSLRALFGMRFDEPYVVEEYVTGDICSYDAILDSHGNPIFENQEEFPPSMAEVARLGLDMAYFSRPSVDPELQRLGRAAAKGFGLASRFVHMEFFRLTEDKPGLAGVGEYVGLEVNVRPPGGYTPDMLNYAHATDVYQIWADMVCFDERRLPDNHDDAFCAYVGRRDGVRYVHGFDDVIDRYGNDLMAFGRIPDALSDDLGNFHYTARFATEEEVREFESYLTARA